MDDPRVIAVLSFYEKHRNCTDVSCAIASAFTATSAECYKFRTEQLPLVTALLAETKRADRWQMVAETGLGKATARRCESEIAAAEAELAKGTTA